MTFPACAHERAEELPFYSLYASRTDLTVAQVTGFHLNDSVKVDVVILVADDTTAWQGLKDEFDIRTSEGVTSWIGDLEYPQQRTRRGSKPVWRAMAVHDERTLAFYRIENQTQYQALLDYQLNKISNK